MTVSRLIELLQQMDSGLEVRLRKDDEYSRDEIQIVSTVTEHINGYSQPAVTFVLVE